MNKLSKGLLVGGLGAALLLGSGGTLALWNAAASSDAGAIVLGDVDLAVPAQGKVWEAKDAAGTWQPIADINAFRMVPGDEVRLTQPLEVTLTGDNLQADLSVDTASAITTPAGETAPEGLLTVSTAFTGTPAGETAPTQVDGGNTWRFASALKGGTATYTQQVVFALSPEASDRVGANTTIDLAATKFVLQQAR